MCKKMLIEIYKWLFGYFGLFPEEIQYDWVKKGSRVDLKFESSALESKNCSLINDLLVIFLY